MLDVGTNNPTLLNDPLYLGWRHPRLSGRQFDEFIEAFVTAIKKKLPGVFLHWEDFGRDNARRVLDLYRDKICSFNDDMQGTGAVALAAILAAVKANNSQIKDQRLLVFGAGTAGVGITDQICTAMMRQGLTQEQARRQFWLVDRQGLLTESTTDLAPFQVPYRRSANEIKKWGIDANQKLQLIDVIRYVKPTILIGCSTCRGAFDEAVVKEMASFNVRPIIFPLSNPNEKCEAYPADVLRWTNGNALVATGSPFAPVTSGGRQITIAQCNNALIFPGIGLGVLAAQATMLSDEMLYAAVEVLSNASPIRHDNTAPLLPGIEQSRIVARDIAIAIARVAKSEGLARAPQNETVEQWIERYVWEPKYLPFKAI